MPPGALRKASASLRPPRTRAPLTSDARRTATSRMGPGPASKQGDSMARVSQASQAPPGWDLEQRVFVTGTSLWGRAASPVAGATGPTASPLRATMDHASGTPTISGVTAKGHVKENLGSVVSSQKYSWVARTRPVSACEAVTLRSHGFRVLFVG